VWTGRLWGGVSAEGPSKLEGTVVWDTLAQREPLQQGQRSGPSVRSRGHGSRRPFGARRRTLKVASLHGLTASLAREGGGQRGVLEHAARRTYRLLHGVWSNATGLCLGGMGVSSAPVDSSLACITPPAVSSQPHRMPQR
jgi:hypothetical protein